MWTGTEWKDYDPPKPERPVVEVDEEKVQRTIRLTFSAAFGGWDPAFEPHAKELTRYLCSDAARVFAKPKPVFNSCRNCTYLDTTYGSNYCKNTDSSELKRCSSVRQSLPNPEFCPKYELRIGRR